MRRALALTLGLLLALPVIRAAKAGPDDWSALYGQAVALMRHGGAVLGAPGAPPPVPGCDTRAVLTDAGRDEMRRLGDRLRAEGVMRARLVTSRQCSAWETAELLRLGPVTLAPALEPLVGPLSPADHAARQQALRDFVVAASQAQGPGAVPVIMVTHRANIAALTGIEVPHGEILLLRPSQVGLGLVGRLSAD